MANVSISGLPEQTGKTNDDVLAIVDSGETTTSKIKVSTLLSGVGTDIIKESVGTDSFVSRNNDTTDTNGNIQFVLGGSNCDITSSTANNGIIGGANCNLTSGGISGIVFAQNADLSGTISSVYGGDNNDIVNSSYSQIFGGEYNLITANYSQIVSGIRNEVRSNNCGVILGRENIIESSSGIYNFMIGGFNNDIKSTCSGSNTNIGGTNNVFNGSTRGLIINGTSNTLSTTTGSVIISGSGNTNSNDYSVILGGIGLSTNYDYEVVCEHLTTSGQSRGNFYNNLSGDTFTIDWDEGNLQKVYMTGDTSLTFSNVKNGATYKLQVENGGSYSITGATASGFTILCEGGSIPNITNNGVDLCVLEVMDTDILVRHFANFSTP